MRFHAFSTPDRYFAHLAGGGSERMSQLFENLKRRNVFRVGAAYGIVGWLLVEVASVLLPAFHAPEWVFQTFAIVVMLGFPIALVLAWAFELTSEGIKWDKDVEVTESTRNLSGRKLDFAIIALLAMAVFFFVIKDYVLEAEPMPAPVTVVSEQPPTAEPARS